MKCQRLTPSGCKDIAIWKSEFVAKTQFLYQSFWCRSKIECLNAFSTTQNYTFVVQYKSINIIEIAKTTLKHVQKVLVAFNDLNN